MPQAINEILKKPIMRFEAALLKLDESELTPAQAAAVRHGHATLALSRA